MSREEEDQPVGSGLGLKTETSRGAIGETASRSKLAHLDASRMVPAKLRVQEALLAMGAVTVHDCDDHVPLEMLKTKK